MYGNLSAVLVTGALITDHWIVTTRENTEQGTICRCALDTYNAVMCKWKLCCSWNMNTGCFTHTAFFEDQGESEKKLQEIKGIGF